MIPRGVFFILRLGGVRVLGYVQWREEEEPFAERITLCGVPFLAVRVERGRGLRGRYALRRAAKRLQRAHVRQAVFPPDFPALPLFASYGVAEPDIRALRGEKAEEVVRAALWRRGLRPGTATLALEGGALSRSAADTVLALARSVRYLSLRFPDAEALAARLRREYGVAVQHTGAADVVVRWGTGTAAEDALPMLLPLYDASLAVEYASDTLPPEALREPMLAALLAAGALRTEELHVKSVKFQPISADTGTSA